ncbi:Spc7 kinetochore protein-domain-containing protein [Hygrophoropsis aurantiaca]|uniref:Spc7 kinetochore protein-domain-containing protein n=1 Tax=Hygrophoropsis aurantiaca TaxID=72124 RepID=A0ACB8AQE3_9AGAM|nr:Spc7 kinetochore protein-domain-containing protein [Hygrophoropsis aurantiaca]
MVGSRGSPSRRKSIAVTNQNQPAHPGRRRRAYSITPGDRLSPASKARRSLAPRKSILKAAINIPDDDDATQSMELTRDFRTEIHDNTSRKSLGRRVSFANHAHVRLFEVPEANTNSTTSPQSSPAAEAGPSRPGPTDENAYPGGAGTRRRSSMRRSVAFSEGGGEESMDMDSDDTGYSPAAFLNNMNGDPVQQDHFDDDDMDFEDDMEVTEAINPNILRKRSLSLGGPRRPLATVAGPADPPENPDGTGSAENSFIEEGSTQSQSFTSEGDVTQPMEFTVPLVRPPAPPSEAWLALRSVTHSGDKPYEPEASSDDDNVPQGMDLTDALTRLTAARASLGQGSGVDDEHQEDSFTSTEDSFGDDNAEENGNQTINVTQLMRRVSLGAGDHDGNSTMDMSSTYDTQEDSRDAAVNLAVDGPPSSLPETPSSADTSVQNQPSPEAGQSEQPLNKSSNVFTAPTPRAQPMATSSTHQPPTATVPKPFTFSFTPRSHTSESPSRPRAPISPSKSNTSAKPTFSAAFAPPVSRPSPKKRPISALDDLEDRPSPKKKQTGTAKLSSVPTAAFKEPSASQPLRTPAKLSPSKKAPFQVHFDSQGRPSTSDAAPGKRASTGFRRPSGYFAQRKSIGGTNTVEAEPAGENRVSRPSPAKKAAIGLGRKSIAFPGDGDEDAWTRFDAAAEKASLAKETAPQEVHQAQEIEVSDQPSEPIDDVVRESLALPPPSSESTPVSNSPNNRYSPAPILSQPQTHALILPAVVSESDVQPAEIDTNEVPLDMEDPTEQWRGDIPEGDFGEEDRPQISIEQFFEMTGIRFMDEIAAPRRSTMHPSSRGRRRSSIDTDVPLADYAVAMAVDVPQLELYTHVSKDLQAWIERINAIYQEAEEEALKMTPELFLEFVSADEDGQAELLHQLKLIKINNISQAKSEWYDWKTQWVEQLYQNADQGFKDLEADAKVLEDIVSQAQKVVPALKEEYDQVMLELEQEKADVAELEDCDPDYLSELKATIAEQNAELDGFRGDLNEGKAKLEKLQEKLDETESQKKDVTIAIHAIERLIHVQKNSTRAEVFRLQEELEALQNLHMWQATKVHPDRFEFIYASSYCVSIPCVKFRPILEEVEVKRVEKAKTKYKDAFPVLNALMLLTAKRLISTTSNKPSVREIVEKLGDYWSSCAQLLSQLKLVAIKYPVSIEVIPDGGGASGFSATATLLFPEVKAKALVSFIMDVKTFSSWPMSIHGIQCNVRVAYGPVDGKVLQNAVVGRLKQASPGDSHACLLDACMEAMDNYS